MPDQEDSFSPSARWRIAISDRVTRLEGSMTNVEASVERMCAEMSKNTATTDEVFASIRGLKTLGNLIVWIAGVGTAITVFWAAVRFLAGG